MGWQSNMLNNVFAAAFLILLCCPADLFEVGFQLSFAAVIGIVFFLGTLKTYLAFPKSIASGLSVTISAQLEYGPDCLLF